MSASYLLAVVAVAVVAIFVVACIWGGDAVLGALTRPTRPPNADTLRYHLVVGQDSSSILDEVRKAGYTADIEFMHGRDDLLVVFSADVNAEREDLRRIIAAAPTRDGGERDFAIPPVRFVDEES